MVKVCLVVEYRGRNRPTDTNLERNPSSTRLSSIGLVTSFVFNGFWLLHFP